MRLAVFSDIHANLVALDAALKQLEPLEVDGYIIAGDSFSGPDPSGVYARLCDLNCWAIRGNHEDYLLRFHNGQAPDWWYTSRQWGFMLNSFNHLSPATLESIATLPDQLRIDLPAMHPIRVVHGSPRSISELVLNPHEDPTLLEIALSQVSEPVVIFGHTHQSWQFRVDGRLALNPGALSCNFSGPARGGYAILDWTPAGWQPTLCDVEFDIHAVRESFRSGGLLESGGAISEYWLRSIETGRNLLPYFLDFAIDLANRSGYAASPFVPDHILDQAGQLFAVQNDV